MRCNEIQEHLSAYLDDELDADLRAQVEREIEQCPACRELLDSLRSVHDQVASLPRVAAPALTVSGRGDAERTALLFHGEPPGLAAGDKVQSGAVHKVGACRALEFLHLPKENLGKEEAWICARYGPGGAGHDSRSFSRGKTDGTRQALEGAFEPCSSRHPVGEERGKAADLRWLVRSLQRKLCRPLQPPVRTSDELLTSAPSAFPADSLTPRRQRLENLGHHLIRRLPLGVRIEV